MILSASLFDSTSVTFTPQIALISMIHKPRGWLWKGSICFFIQ